MTEREVRMLGLLGRMHSAWTATSITRQVTFDAAVIHKAVSAESILRYCLRANGWTAAYKRGELSELQHIELLKDVKEYCEAWLKHEARKFASDYLARALVADVLPASSEPPLARSLPTDEFFERMGNTSGSMLVWQPDQAIRAGGWLRYQADRFFGRVRQFVREGIVAGVMGLLGPTPLSEDDLNGIDREVATQSGYLSRFENEVMVYPPEPISEEPRPGPRPMTPEEFVARTASYGASVYGSSQRVGRASSVRAQVREERRILGDPETEHCEDCPDLSAQGWQPVGTLPDIGTVQCKHRCLCHFEYRFYEDGPSFTRVRPGVYNPAGE